MVDTRSQFLRNQAINRTNTVRKNRAIADRNNDLQYAMSRSPEFYQDPKNRASVKGVLERTPAITTDQNESRNMYQMLMNQMKGGDSGARLIDTRGLPTGAYRTGRTLFTDPAKSQGFLRDVGSLFTGKNQAAVRAPEYSPFPNAGFGKQYYKDTFGKFDFGGLMEGIAKIASPLKYLPKRDRVPLDRDPDFLPENNPFPIEYDKIEPYEEPITFLPQEEYEGSGMETNPFYNYVGASADAPDITNDIVGDSKDTITNTYLEEVVNPEKVPLYNLDQYYQLNPTAPGLFGDDYSGVQEYINSIVNDPDNPNYKRDVQDLLKELIKKGYVVEGRSD